VRALVLLALASVCAAQTGDEKPSRADYRLKARYDEPERRIQGEGTIYWKNESRDDVFDLWFHLYWNAFANDRSTHLFVGGNTRAGGVRDDEWGWTRITSLVIDGHELLPQLEYVSPDDQRPDDRTVARVRLPRTVKRDEGVTVQLRWESRVPRVRVRTGQKDDFLFIAQWFPKLGVYETGNGWNCHQFHPSTEFFADYGAYDVTLDLPAAYENRIGASGLQVEPARVADGRVKVRFEAPSPKTQTYVDRTGHKPLVHDFAWTADKQYVKYEATFHFDEWAAKYADEVDRVALALGRGRDEMRLRDVDVTVLLQPEHVDQGARHFDATCTALFFYGLWFGEYPYEHITVVDPAWGGGGAGGMEYPTLFTAGTSMYTKPSMQTPESVTVHECGHQFWYGLVGNNEFEAAWLDEGFNTFTQNEAMWLRYGPSSRTTSFAALPFDGVPLANAPGGNAIGDALAGKRLSLWGGITLEPLRASGFIDWWRDQPLFSYSRQRIDPRDSARNGYLGDPDTDPVDKPAWLYCDRASYRTNSYRRTATALRTLQGLVGADRFLRGMRTYSERWRFRHPYPQDFFDAFIQGAQIDVSWYFEQAFRSTATVDWRVEVTQKKLKDPRGWFQDSSGTFVKRDAKSDDAASDASEDKKGDWSVDLVVKRKGDLLLPLALDVTYEDGVKEHFTWSREDQTRSTWWKPLAGRERFTSKVASAVLDPERRYMLDRNMSDNQWHDEVDRAAPLRWSERVFEQYAALLHWWGGLGG
jgi:hypothetical protein